MVASQPMMNQAAPDSLQQLLSYGANRADNNPLFAGLSHANIGALKNIDFGQLLQDLIPLVEQVLPLIGQALGNNPASPQGGGSEGLLKTVPQIAQQQRLTAGTDGPGRRSGPAFTMMG